MLQKFILKKSIKIAEKLFGQNTIKSTIRSVVDE